MLLVVVLAGRYKSASLRVVLMIADLPSARASALSRRDTTMYSKDLINTLRMIATQQRQYRLAELLDAAAMEAERLIGRASKASASRK